MGGGGEEERLICRSFLHVRRGRARKMHVTSFRESNVVFAKTICRFREGQTTFSRRSNDVFANVK